MQIQHGKSSITTAIGQIGNFMSSDWKFQLEIERIVEERIAMGDRFKEHIMRMPKIDINNKEKNARFCVEMYIKADESTTGYYTYELIMDKDIYIKGIKEEKLTYKKNYKDIPIEVIKINNNYKSQIGYLYTYSENLKGVGEQVDSKEVAYAKTFFDHYIENSNLMSIEQNVICDEEDVIDWIKKQEKNKVLKAINLVDKSIKDLDVIEKYEKKHLILINLENIKLRFRMLSSGTKKMLKVLFELNKLIERNGIFVIDEIEIGIHFDLVKLIIDLFSDSDKYCQIFFTTGQPEVLNKDFKNDQIVYLEKQNLRITANKFSDYTIDGKKVRSDKSFSNLYKEKKISVQPNNDDINIFRNEFLNNSK